MLEQTILYTATVQGQTLTFQADDLDATYHLVTPVMEARSYPPYRFQTEAEVARVRAAYEDLRSSVWGTLMSALQHIERNGGAKVDSMPVEALVETMTDVLTIEKYRHSLQQHLDEFDSALDQS